MDATHTGVDHFFRTQRPNDTLARLGQDKRDIEYEIFSTWAETAHVVDDFEVEITHIQHAIGESKAAVEKAIFAYRRLIDLPGLRQIQHTTRLLDIKRLASIDTAIAELGPGVDTEVYAHIDAYLVEVFTATKPNQPLLTPKAIVHRLRRLIAQLDNTVGYDAAKRKRRTRPQDAFVIYDYELGARSGTTIECDNTTHALIRQYRTHVAQENNITEDEAARLILTGELTAQPTVTIFGFAPLGPDGDIVDGASVFFPGTGWTDAEGSAVAEQYASRIVDLGDVAGHEIDGYVPSARIKAFAIARDGTCVWPGCTRDAQHCQLDHRVPYADGGSTTPANLFSLCQRHHNVKTDRRAYYIPDPTTGDIVWLFADGTYALTEPDGFITTQLGADNPRWNHSLDQRRVLRDRVATFLAKGHTILDAYDTTGNYDTCIEALTRLEQEYRMTFPHKPTTNPDANSG
ncbi:HNH endonuclease signature motif containing protein [Corynebacterium sanguinis]|uniref:HNH endonuclease signature motif containing protein n=1 Tax=Corynebacterium sanguinis TaxID=2594913 RepID=UPI001FE35CE6|nr:HNH endonuclease signature motif containing protein [Corynebacterium sanguinis]